VDESRQLAEEARQRRWRNPSFLRELFLGRLRLDLLEERPAFGGERPQFRAFYERLSTFLRERVDSAGIDQTGEYPPDVIASLAGMGAFGMIIPEEYGGLGLSRMEYARIMELLGSFDGNLTALLSAHQSIGVPQPILLFGTPDQKRRFLPRCAAGAISAFALTEPDVGSDPARLSTSAEATADGQATILNGEKLWCTNGTLAELLVVMARDTRTRKISAFVVDTRWSGVEIMHRCHFMGLRALANAAIRFRNVRVPLENRIGPEGAGLKIALATLNTGRLALPAAVVGTAKRCLEIARSWAVERVQWGQPIGRHEAIGDRLADLAATTFAMQAMSDTASRMADRGDRDIRLEAAAAKVWNTTMGWRIVDHTMQIRGGRGYETERSLANRGEPPIPVERIMRDFRINLIFEGSTEIMHLFEAREAVDRHIEIAGPLLEPAAGFRRRLLTIARMVAFYLWWYPTRLIGWGFWPRYRQYGTLGRYLRFAERQCRRLARQIFYGMLVHRARLERRQAFLFRIVDIAHELFAIVASILRAHRMAELRMPDAGQASELADVFCRRTRRDLRALFRCLWHNDDARRYRLGRRVLDGKHAWLEQGMLPIDWRSVRMMRPSERRAG
jgi:hypothetical protein